MLKFIKAEECLVEGPRCHNEKKESMRTFLATLKGNLESYQANGNGLEMSLDFSEIVNIVAIPIDEYLFY
jgi:hypothetical protein